jgi:hypothetical protein
MILLADTELLSRLIPDDAQFMAQKVSINTITFMKKCINQIVPVY